MPQAAALSQVDHSCSSVAGLHLPRVVGALVSEIVDAVSDAAPLAIIVLEHAVIGTLHRQLMLLTEPGQIIGRDERQSACHGEPGTVTEADIAPFS